MALFLPSMYLIQFLVSSNTDKQIARSAAVYISVHWLVNCWDLENVEEIMRNLASFPSLHHFNDQICAEDGRIPSDQLKH